MNDMTKEERIKKACDLFLQGFNCSQSVFGAYADDYGIPLDLALRLSASFGGGIGRTRSTCGAVCGMAMLVGLEEGQTQPGDSLQKQKNYKAVQELMAKVREKHGSTQCAELLKLRADAKVSSVPQARTEDYYRTRPCLRMVETAVSLFEDWKLSRTKDI